MRAVILVLAATIVGCAKMQRIDCAQKASDHTTVHDKVAALIAEGKVPEPNWRALDQEFIEAEGEDAISYTAYFKGPPLGSISIRFDCDLKQTRIRYNKYGQFSDYGP